MKERMFGSGLDNVTRDVTPSVTDGTRLTLALQQQWQYSEFILRDNQLVLSGEDVQIVLEIDNK